MQLDQSNAIIHHKNKKAFKEVSLLQVIQIFDTNKVNIKIKYQRKESTRN